MTSGKVGNDMKRTNKKYWYSYFVCIFGFGIFLLSGCEAGQRKNFSKGDRLKIVTTIYPMENFAQEIAGDKAEIINLVPAGVEPHDFELSTGDMMLIEEADVFIYNGAGMEHFVDKTLQAVSNKELVLVEAAKDVPLLTAAAEKYDPHTWLSIKNAIIEAETIKDALCMADSENTDYYNTNFEQYRERLLDLENRYQNELSGLSKNTIVTAHEAFGYLCEEYGLVQKALEGLSADSEPDSARMKEIIDFCREQDVQVIFFEELVSPKAANAIAEETGARTEVLNPIEGRTLEQEQEGLDYIGMMENNLEVLKEALK